MDAMVITFDGDQTLWDFRAAMRRALERVLAHLQRRVLTRDAQMLTVPTLIRERDQIAEELKGTPATYEEIRRLSFGRILKRIGLDSDDPLRDEIYELYMEGRYGLLEPYPDTIETLNALATHYTIGLISNGNSYPERCGLGDHFDFTVLAPEAGVEKPDPAIFWIAADRAGSHPGAMFHVGDEFEADVLGAKQAGARAAWLNREGFTSPGGIEPDVEVSSLTALLPYLTPGT